MTGLLSSTFSVTTWPATFAASGAMALSTYASSVETWLWACTHAYAPQMMPPRPTTTPTMMRRRRFIRAARGA